MAQLRVSAAEHVYGLIDLYNPFCIEMREYEIFNDDRRTLWKSETLFLTGALKNVVVLKSYTRVMTIRIDSSETVIGTLVSTGVSRFGILPDLTVDYIFQRKTDRKTCFKTFTQNVEFLCYGRFEKNSFVFIVLN